MHNGNTDAYYESNIGCVVVGDWRILGYMNFKRFSVAQYPCQVWRKSIQLLCLWRVSKTVLGFVYSDYVSFFRYAVSCAIASSSSHLTNFSISYIVSREWWKLIQVDFKYFSVAIYAHQISWNSDQPLFSSGGWHDWVAVLFSDYVSLD